MNNRQPRDPRTLAVLASFSGEGGVERMLLNLITAWAERGVNIELLTIRTNSAHLKQLPESVVHIDLGARHSLTAVPALRRYFQRHRPTAMLVAKDRAGRAALLARRLAGSDCPIVIRLGTNLSAALANKSPWQRWLRTRPMRLIYPWVNRVVAVSEGVAQDVVATTGLAPERIEVIRNPVITPLLRANAQAPCPHAWLAPERELPVLMGAGRLTPQKDFPTLLRAFAELQQTHPSRLLILGEGRLRAGLAALSQQLGIAERVQLVGFQSNPHAWLARADVFVLSSRWEGSPNVLTEAMALGRPVVAADCPSGPRELLHGGQFGPLVAMGDVAAMAASMAAVLDDPLPAEVLNEAVSEYNAATSSARYLAVLGLDFTGIKT